MSVNRKVIAPLGSSAMRKSLTPAPQRSKQSDLRAGAQWRYRRPVASKKFFIEQGGSKLRQSRRRFAAKVGSMPRSAARLSRELHDLILELAASPARVAEICRGVGARADELGIARPSYERVRTLVHRARERGGEPSTTGVLFDVAVRARPPEALLDHISGVGVAARRPEQHK